MNDAAYANEIKRLDGGIIGDARENLLILDCAGLNQASIQVHTNETISSGVLEVLRGNDRDATRAIALATPTTIAAVGITTVTVSGFRYLFIRPSVVQAGLTWHVFAYANRT